MSDGGLTLSAGTVSGTSATGVSGDIRTAEGYPSDPYSQVTVGPAALEGDEWRWRRAVRHGEAVSSGRRRRAGGTEETVLSGTNAVRTVGASGQW
jgi:hypothetical protein